MTRLGESIHLVHPPGDPHDCAGGPFARRGIGERLLVWLDDIQVTVLVYYGNRPRLARYDVARVGVPVMLAGQAGGAS